MRTFVFFLQLHCATVASTGLESCFLFELSKTDFLRKNGYKIRNFEKLESGYFVRKMRVSYAKTKFRKYLSMFGVSKQCIVKKV